MEFLFLSFLLALALVVTFTAALQHTRRTWGLQCRFGRTVILEAADVTFPASCLSWTTPVPPLSIVYCHVKHVSVSVDLAQILKLNLPFAFVLLTDAELRVDVLQKPSGLGPNFAFCDRLRYLKAIERIVFKNSWVHCTLEDLQQYSMSWARAMALLIAAQCVSVDVRSISVHIVNGVGRDDLRCPTLCNSSKSGPRLDIHMSVFRVHPARKTKHTVVNRLRESQVSIDVVGVDIACCCLSQKKPPVKVLRRWGVTASLKLWNQTAQLLQAAEIHGKASICAKSLVLECGPDQAMEVWQIVHSCIKCQSLLVYAGHRPPTTVQKDPAAWWRYAIRCVLQHVHQHSDERHCSPRLLGKLPSLVDEYARQKKRPGTAILWNEDLGMTTRQSCCLRFLAWYATRRQGPFDGRSIVSVHRSINALLSSTGHFHTRNNFTLHLDVSCPRTGIEFAMDSQQTTIVTMINVRCCLRLDQLLHTHLDRPANRCSADISVGKLHVAHMTSGSAANVIDSPMPPQGAGQTQGQPLFLNVQLHLPATLASSRCRITMADTKITYEPKPVRYMLDSISYLARVIDVDDSVPSLGRYVCHQLDARRSLRTHFLQRSSSLPFTFQCKRVHVTAHCRKGTSLILQLSALYASLNSAQPLPSKCSPDTLESALHETLCDMTSPRISAVSKGKNRGCTNNADANDFTTSPAKHRTAEQDPSASQSGSISHSSASATCFTSSQKAIMKAFLEVDQVTHTRNSIRRQNVLPLLELGAVFSKWSQPSLAQNTSQSVTVSIQPMLKCMLTIDVLENLKGLCSSMAGWELGSRQPTSGSPCHIQSSRQAGDSGCQIEQLTLFRCYIPRVSVTCKQAIRQFYDSSGHTQMHDLFNVTFDVHRVLLCVRQSRETVSMIQVAEVSLSVGQSCDPASCVVRSLQPPMSKNLENACMHESEKAQMGSILRQWHTASQMKKLSKSAVCDLAWPPSSSQQLPLIPALRIGHQSGTEEQRAKTSILGLTFQIHPADVIPIKAAVCLLLNLFPGESAQDHQEVISQHHQQKTKVHKSISCTVQLLLVQLPCMNFQEKTSANISLSKIGFSFNMGHMGTSAQAKLHTMAVIDKRATCPHFTAPLVIGMQQEVGGIEIALHHGRTGEVGELQEQQQRLFVQGNGISFIFIHRFLVDMLLFVTSVQDAVSTSLVDCMDKGAGIGAGNAHLHDMDICIKLARVSIIVPETGWSSSMFVINTDLIEIQPFADGCILRNQVQASLAEKIPWGMVQGLSFEHAETEGCYQEVAFDLGTTRGPCCAAPRPASSLKQATGAANQSGEQLFTAVVQSPQVYWTRLKEYTSKSQQHILYREFASGSSIVVSFEGSMSPGQPCVTVFWAQAQILAGEAQFSQLMRTVFGNLGENGFDATHCPNSPSVGSFVPAQNTPSSLDLPKTDTIRFTTNIELGESVFLAEAEGQQYDGTGPDLAQVELSSTKIQHTVTAGGAQRIIVTCDTLCILKSPSFTLSGSDSARQQELLGRTFPVIRAAASQGSADASLPQEHMYTNATIHNTVKKPSAAYDDELRLEMKSNGFLLDYVIHANGGFRGSHCIEVTLRQVDIAWPFIEDFQLVWDIINTYSRFVNVDFVSPFQHETETQAWSFVNIILEHGQVVIISPESATFNSSDLPQNSWYPAILASWDRLRVGYDWGGQAEVALLVNCEAFRLEIASDLKLTAFQRDWVLRQHKIDLHEVVAPFSLNIIWKACTSKSLCPADGRLETKQSMSCASSITTLPSPQRQKQTTSNCQPVTHGQLKYSSSVNCTLVKLRIAMGRSERIHSLIRIAGQVVRTQNLVKSRTTSSLQQESQHEQALHLGASMLPSAMLRVPTSTCTPKSVDIRTRYHSEQEFTEKPGSPVSMQSDDTAVLDYSASQNSLVLSDQRSADSKFCFTRYAAVIPKVHADFSDPDPTRSTFMGHSYSSSNLDPLAQDTGAYGSMRHSMLSGQQACSCVSSNTSASSFRLSGRKYSKGHFHSNVSTKVNFEGIEIVLVDDSCKIESIPSLRISIHETWIVLQAHSKAQINTDGGLGPYTRIHESAHFRTTLRCKYFNSRLDVEEFLISDWPLVLKYDALPAQDVTTASISSSSDLIVRISPACLDTVMDVFTVVNQLVADDTEAEKSSTYGSASQTRLNSSTSLKYHRHEGRDKRSLFKLRNCTGLGVACCTKGEQVKPAARMELSPTGQIIPLTFQPCHELVHLPDLARKVASRTISVQLGSSFIGSIKAIEHVVVDKVGVYAYPLQIHGHRLPQTERSFQCAMIASVHLEHRTKVVDLHTPYQILNKSVLPLQVKLQAINQILSTEASGVLRLPVNPIIQLPWKGSTEEGCTSLRRNEDCFLPITVLAEQPHIIRMYVTAVLDDKKVSQQSECIELLSRDLAKQQGVYKCNSSDGAHYLCLQVNAQQVQAMIHDADHQEGRLYDEFSRHLRYYTLSFLSPLIIRSTLPSPLNMHVTSGTSLSRWVAVNLGPGDEQEISNIDVREKQIMLQFDAPDSKDRHHVQLRRRDGFTKEVLIYRAIHQFPDDPNDDLDLMRVLFTVNVDRECGQTLINISSPIWVVNKCGAKVGILVPRLVRSASHQTCFNAGEQQVFHCKPCLSSETDVSQVKLVGFSGSQSIKLCLPGISSLDKSCWRRISVASIGIKGPIPCQLEIQPKKLERGEAEQADSSLDCLIQAWTPMKQCELGAQNAAGPCQARYDLHVHVAVGRGIFAASKIITIAPAAVCTNASHSPIKVHQCQSDWYLTLQPGQTQPLIWFNSDAKQELIVQPVSKEMAWSWSGKFTVSEAANYMLRVHAKDTYSHYAILPITIMMQGYSIECTIGATSTVQAPYLIHNLCTNHAIYVRQKESTACPTDNRFFQIMPRSPPLPFAWDDIMPGHKLIAAIVPLTEATMSSTKRMAEHEFNIDRKLDISVPLRKVGRVAAFRRGLRDRGYNFVRTVADIQTISHLLDRDRDDPLETVSQTTTVEQEIRVTVQAEGPTHIITFNDNETLEHNGDVLQSLMALHEEAWHVDTKLRKYQDQKGILVDMLLDRNADSDHGPSCTTNGSDEGWDSSLRSHPFHARYSHTYHEIARHCVSIDHARQSAERVYQGENRGGRRWFHKITRASAVAPIKQHLPKRSRSSTMEPHVIPSKLRPAAAAIAESSQHELMQTCNHGRYSEASSNIDSKALEAGTSSGSEIARWVNSWPIMEPNYDVWEHPDNMCQGMSPRRVNFKLTSEAANCEQQNMIHDYDMLDRQTNKSAIIIPGGQRPDAKIEDAGHNASLHSMISHTATRIDGSLRVQLISLRDIFTGNQRRWSGKMQISVQCETFAVLPHTQTSQPVEITCGQGSFPRESQKAAQPVSTTSVPSRGFDVVIRKVPISGVLTLKLLKVTALGAWAVAKTHLHLDKVQHQLHGGHEIEHVLTWQPVRGTWKWGGEVVLHAFWMSTEQERLEMELMALQANVHQKRELLAQLNAKYGDDLDFDSSDSSETEDKVFDWRQTGNLIVDVIEGSMGLVPMRMGIRFKTTLTLLGKQGSEMFKETSWASGIAPCWNNRFKFTNCSKRDVLVLQIFELHRFGADEVRGQTTLPLHSLPKQGQPQYRWIDLGPPHNSCNTKLAAMGETTLDCNRIHVRLEFTDQEEKKACWAMDVTLRGIGLSIIDCVSTRFTRELMFIHIMNVQGRFRQDSSANKHTGSRSSEFRLSFQNIQVDNQLLSASVPVVVCRRQPTRNTKRSGILKAAQRDFERQSQGDPLFNMQCTRILADQNGHVTHGVVFREFFLHLDPLEVCLEEAFLDNIKRFVLMLPVDKILSSVAGSKSAGASGALLHQTLQTADANTQRETSCTGASRWFFESLRVEQITVHLTFVPCHDGERRKNSTLLSVALATGLSISDLDDIRLSVAAFSLESKFASPSQLINMISAHFIRQIWASLHKLVGHVQIIGSTIALGSSLVSGAWYILYQPYFAARSGSRWTEVAQGVLIGTSRAVAEFGSTFFIVLGQLVGVIGTGFRIVSYGRAPIEGSLLRKPPTLTHAIVSGSAIVDASGRHAVRNMVSLPERGWRDHGLPGAAVGLACGISGMLHPIASVFDFTSRTMYGIGAEIEMLGSTGRWRAATRGQRRTHGQAAILADDAACSQESGAVQAWEELLRGTGPELEQLRVVDWVQNSSGRYLILGQEHLVYCRAHGSSKKKRSLVKWILKLEHIASIITVGYTVVISYTDQLRLGRMRLDVPAWHTVACQQEAVVEVIMQKVNRQLDNYFEKRYVKDSAALQGNRLSGQVTPQVLAWSIFDEVVAGKPMVSLRHAIAEVADPRVDSDMTVGMPPSATFVIHAHASKQGSASSMSGMTRACFPDIRGKLQPIQEGMSGCFRAGKRKTLRGNSSHAKVARVTKAWKMTAFAAIRSVHAKLASAEGKASCTVALLYAHARVGGLLQEASSMLQGQYEPTLTVIEAIKGLCDPWDSLDDEVSRCLAAAMACKDFLRFSDIEPESGSTQRV